ALANPSMMIVIPLAAAYVAVQRATPALRAAHALAALVASGILIAPATWHNYRASGEFVPVVVSSRVTFYQGNYSGAVGTYTTPPGFSGSRTNQYVEAMDMYTRATGRPPAWGPMDRYFMLRGWHELLVRPEWAFKLWTIKAWRFLTGYIVDEVSSAYFEV